MNRTGVAIAAPVFFGLNGCHDEHIILREKTKREHFGAISRLFIHLTFI